MFIQVLQGSTTDHGGIRRALDRWVSDVVPGSPGYLGSTTGVTEDGTVISIARYESSGAAEAIRSRHEFQQWWTETSQLFVEPPSFWNSADVFVNLVGDPDNAGFVQVMRGHLSDPVRARELMERHVDQLNALRPDIVGRLAALHDGGDYTQVIYFTSEEAARQAENPTFPPELVPLMLEMRALNGRPDYYDLKEPWLTSP